MDSTNDVTLKNNQSIDGKKTFNDTLTTAKGLNASNARIINVARPMQNSDAVNKKYVDSLISILNEFKMLNTKVKDLEGNLYSIIKINDQIWMKENLRTTRYQDGSPIPLVTNNVSWGTAIEG